MNWYLKVLKDYAVFNGRARRSEYWYFALVNLIITIILAAIGYSINFRFVDTIYSFAVLIPSIAVGVRRMHDLDKSGWFILVPIYNLILACTDGTHGPNRFGEDPKGRPAFGADDYERPYDIQPNA